MMNTDNLLYTKTAQAIYGDGGVKFGAFKLKSHNRWPGAPLSPLFLSLRKQGSSNEHECPLTPETVDMMGQLIVARYGELIAHSTAYIAGIPNAGDPIVDAIMNHLPANAKAKRLYLEKVGTGDGRRIALKAGETYEPGAKVLLVDDLISKADSKVESANALRAAGMIVEVCIVMVDRQQGGPEEAEASGLTIISIYKLDDLLQIYLDEKLIDAPRIKEVRTYQVRFREYTNTHPPIDG